MGNKNCLIDKVLLYNIRRKELEKVLKYINFMIELNRARVALEKAYSECPALLNKNRINTTEVFFYE